jgi:hypothetical protein
MLKKGSASRKGCGKMKNNTDNNKPKRPKRFNGDGSIVVRSNGRVVGMVTIGRDLNGKLIRKYVYGKTKDEVKKKVIEIQKDSLYGNYTDETKITLSNWLKKWLEVYKKNDIREQTKELYRGLIKTNIDPFIGKNKLSKITQLMLQQYFNGLSEKH